MSPFGRMIARSAPPSRKIHPRLPDSDREHRHQHGHDARHPRNDDERHPPSLRQRAHTNAETARELTDHAHSPASAVQLHRAKPTQRQHRAERANDERDTQGEREHLLAISSRRADSARSPSPSSDVKALNAAASPAPNTAPATAGSAASRNTNSATCRSPNLIVLRTATRTASAPAPTPPRCSRKETELRRAPRCRCRDSSVACAMTDSTMFRAPICGERHAVPWVSEFAAHSVSIVRQMFLRIIRKIVDGDDEIDEGRARPKMAFRVEVVIVGVDIGEASSSIYRSPDRPRRHATTNGHAVAAIRG